jgi:chromosome segregation ATPase
MAVIEELTTVEEIDATIAQLREKKRALKKVGKSAERKIATLARRRERYMDRVREIEAQIEELRREASAAPVVRRRGRRPKSAVASE